jgi:virulence-associated protein VagC
LRRISEPDTLRLVTRKRNAESVVFRSGNSLAVRLVGECRLPRGTRIREYREGGRVILEPISGWPAAFRKAIGSVRGPIPRPPSERKQRDPFR